MRTLFFIFISLFSLYAHAQNEKNEELSVNEKHIKDRLDDYIKNGISENPVQEEKLLRSLMSESEKANYDLGVFRSGSYLMSLYEKSSKNNEVLQVGNSMKKRISENDSDPRGIISAILRRTGIAYANLGLDGLSRKDLLSALHYAETIKDQDMKNYRKALLYENLTLYFLNKPVRNKQINDSIFDYLNKSLASVLKIKNQDGYFTTLKPETEGFTHVRLGMYYLDQAQQKGNLEKAEYHLLKSYKIYNNKQLDLSPYNYNVLLNQMSWLYVEKKDYMKAISFAKQALELEKKYRDPENRVESFEFLADSYTSTGETKLGKHYLEEYQLLRDSLNRVNRNSADVVSQKVSSDIKKDAETDSKINLMMMAAVLLLIVISLIFYVRRYKRYMKTKYNDIIENLKNEKKNKPVKIYPENGDDMVLSKAEKDILEKLLLFEQSTDFLKKDFTISYLAEQFNTNTKYLSTTINKYKMQNFSTYINNLRVNYIVHQLFNDPKYRQYKISYLSEECGFVSYRVFIKTFKSVYGVTPTYFISNLEIDAKKKNSNILI